MSKKNKRPSYKSEGKSPTNIVQFYVDCARKYLEARKKAVSQHELNRVVYAIHNWDGGEKGKKMAYAFCSVFAEMSSEKFDSWWSSLCEDIGQAKISIGSLHFYYVQHNPEFLNELDDLRSINKGGKPKPPTPFLKIKMKPRDPERLKRLRARATGETYIPPDKKDDEVAPAPRDRSNDTGDPFDDLDENGKVAPVRPKKSSQSRSNR